MEKKKKERSTAPLIFFFFFVPAAFSVRHVVVKRRVWAAFDPGTAESVNPQRKNHDDDHHINTYNYCCFVDAIIIVVTRFKVFRVIHFLAI